LSRYLQKNSCKPRLSYSIYLGLAKYFDIVTVGL
jgi:hypothetical protein